jgi:hypothetical protein
MSYSRGGDGDNNSSGPNYQVRVRYRIFATRSTPRPEIFIRGRFFFSRRSDFVGFARGFDMAVIYSQVLKNLRIDFNPMME